MSNYISENLKLIKQKVSEACRVSGRSEDAIKILAVSKKQSIEVMRLAIEAGINSFAENYVQEFLQKQIELSGQDINWDFIGQLQSKKIKDVVGKVDIIHSVDRVKVIQEIEKQCKNKNIKQKILFEVNIASEDSKAGFSEEQLEEALGHAKSLENVIPVGLMIMPPLCSNPEELRPYFKKAKELLSQIQKKYSWNRFTELSMGTSGDFQIAVEEGATIVRIGSSLLGERK